MDSQQILLFILVVAFLAVGGLIDYWQSGMEHKKPIPKSLIDYFLVLWLILYTGIIPFLFIYIASGFSFSIALTTLGALSIGAIVWDLVFSKLDKGALVSDQVGYFVFRQKNYNLARNQIFSWHVIRGVIGLILLFIAGNY